MFLVLTGFTILSFIAEVKLLDNGIALRPPMGWLSWGYYECAVNCTADDKNCLNEKLIMSVADHFYNEGYIDVGYEYIILDDCWSEMERDENHRLVADKKRFPRGMKFLADYIHSKGLKFGMYTCIGQITCKKYPGARGYFDIDAQTYAEWEIDYLKVDGCFVQKKDLNKDYITFGKALNRTNRPILYACSWPYYIDFIINEEPDFEAAAKYCNLFRAYHDIFPNWVDIENTLKYFYSHDKLVSKYNGPGHWFDPDMLLAGKGIGRGDIKSIGPLRVQMALFAMISAPLLFSCPMDSMNVEEKELLLNPDLIAIAQDSEYTGRTEKSQIGNVAVWLKKHEPRDRSIYPSCSVALINFNDRDVQYKFGINSFKNCYPRLQEYTVVDIFQRKVKRNITSNDTMHVAIPGHGKNKKLSHREVGDIFSSLKFNVQENIVRKPVGASRFSGRIFDSGDTVRKLLLGIYCEKRESTLVTPLVTPSDINAFKIIVD